MRGQHWTRELLWALVREPERRGEILQQGVEHLLALCPRCQEEYEAVLQEVQCRESQRPATYGEAFERAFAKLGAAQTAAAEEERRAEETLAALQALPPGQRLEATWEEPERYRGPVLAEKLLAEAQAQMPDQPREARTLLRLARTVLDHTPSSPHVVELYARVLAHLGNVARVLEDLPTAGQLLAHARHLLASHGPAEPAVLAEVAHLEASLRRDERRLPESMELLTRAVDQYREAGLAREAARALLKLGLTHREAGELEAAHAMTRRALADLDPAIEPRLALMARHNLALILSDAGRHQEARLALRQAQSLSPEDHSRWVQLHFLWLEGRIAAGLGEEETAAGAFRAVQAGFLREERPYDAAVVTLDLAALYQRQGRTAEVKALAEDMVTVFGSKGIHREATAALLLFVQAARREEVTAELLHHITTYLQAARHNPALPFLAEEVRPVLPFRRPG